MKIDKTSYALNWDKDEDRLYETGVSRGVLYVYRNATDETPGGYENGVVWNGLTQVQETPSGAEANAQYADDIKYLNLYSVEELGATIEAFTYPKQFMECDGSVEVAKGVYAGQQTRKKFALCYTTRIGSEAVEDRGYKLHILYGCKASPSERAYASVNDSPEAITFSWEVTTSPVEIAAGMKDSALITVDSTVTPEAKMIELEKNLFGAPATTGEDAQEAIEPHLLMPNKIIEIVGVAA